MPNAWDDKEFMVAYMKNYNCNYYANRKDLLKTKVKCENCNKEVNLSSYQKHLKSSSHYKHSLSKEERQQLMINKILAKNVSTLSK